MADGPEALLRAMGLHRVPELAPDASNSMRDFAAIVTSHPFVYKEREVLKLVEEPLSRLKCEPSEVRVSFVFEALNGMVSGQEILFKMVLKAVASALLRSGAEYAGVP